MPQDAVFAVPDGFRYSTHTGRNYGRASCHRLDHHDPLWLVPGRQDEGGGASEQAEGAFRRHPAEEHDPVAESSSAGSRFECRALRPVPREKEVDFWIPVSHMTKGVDQHVKTLLGYESSDGQQVGTLSSLRIRRSHLAQVRTVAHDPSLRR
jgi:hypothetical protein